jgi:WXG100 family type VII secretion target
VKASPEQLRQAKANFQTQSAALEEVVRKIAADISALSETWDGAAAASFQTIMQEWNQGITQVNEALTSIALHLGMAADAYETTDQDLVFKQQ